VRYEVDMVISSKHKDYGSLEWFVHEYANVNVDPWGLSWRPSQALRYQKVLSILETIPEPISSAIDIGCATGDFTHLLLNRMPNLKVLLGSDFVKSAVERAHQRFPSVNFVKESIFSVGQRYERQFDLAACLEVLYYLEEGQRSSALKSVRKVLRDGGYAVFSSFISAAPYFTPDQLLDLIGSEFQVIGSEVLHLKMVNLLESAARRSDKLVLTLTGGRRDGFGVRALRQLPFSTVIALEKWSRSLKMFSASHTIVLAKARG
jgi:SAM-dependent methyltransferase